MTRAPFALLEWMRKNGVPVTREAYVGLAYGNYPPDEEWTPEHEATLRRSCGTAKWTRS